MAARSSRSLVRRSPSGERITVRSTAGSKGGVSPAIWLGLLGVGAIAAAYFWAQSAQAATVFVSVGGWIPVSVGTDGTVKLTGGRYLLSLNATAIQAIAPTNATLATAVQTLESWGFTVVSSHDVNDLPAGWPSDDTGPGEWRFEVTVPAGQTIQLKLSSGERIYTSPNA